MIRCRQPARYGTVVFGLQTAQRELEYRSAVLGEGLGEPIGVDALLGRVGQLGEPVHAVCRSAKLRDCE